MKRQLLVVASWDLLLAIFFAHGNEMTVGHVASLAC